MAQTSASDSSFAKILLGLDGSSYARAATEYACRIASEHHAAITGIAVIDLPGIERAAGPAPIGAQQYAVRTEQRIIKQTREKAGEILRSFGEACQSREIDYVVHTDTGSPFREIIEESKFHDLIVIGQETFFRHDVKHESGDTLRRVLKHGLTAVFAVPDQFRKIRKVVVSYDNSVQAAKAVQMFLLLGIWNSCDITLLHVNSNLKRGNDLLSRLSDYFESYGVTPERVCLRGKPEPTILSYVHENEVDLLVMGAYGSRGVADFFLGSVTKALIDKANIPLFLYH